MSKIYPETLKELFVEALKNTPDFEFVDGVQPFAVKYEGRQFYIFIANLSSAYFKSRPDTTRAQLNRRECFEPIKASPDPFVFLGYDEINDVYVCWNYHIAKTRLNEKSSVSFYSRKFYQEQIISGEPQHFKLKNGDTPYFFKRKDLPLFFERFDSLFPETENVEDSSSISKNIIGSTPKLSFLQDEALLEKIRPLLTGISKHTLEAAQIIMNYGAEHGHGKISIRECMNIVKALQF